MTRTITEAALKITVKWHKHFLLCDPREAYEMELNSNPVWQVFKKIKMFTHFCPIFPTGKV